MKEISLHLLDIIQNSVAAGAGRICLKLEADIAGDLLIITIDDNGRGMDEQLLQSVTSPFATTRTTRRVGLGVPLFKDAAECTGGFFGISSVKGEGTVVKAGFVISSIDRLPLGDLAGTVTDLIMSGPEINYILNLQCKEKLFNFDTNDIKARLGDVPITEFGVLSWILEYLNEGVLEIFGGVLNEINS